MKILIVGAGLYGAVCAHELSKRGHSCHVIDQRNHIGGNIYTKYSQEAECHEHVYGAHIFHTNSKKIWDYINQFSDFNHFTNRVKVNYKGELYSFPINLFTLYQIYGVKTPNEAKIKIHNDLLNIENPKNMEEFCLATIGKELYGKFIEGYTQKQWGKHPRDLPADIVKRIPFRLNFDDNYFNDKYQGIPVNGYTSIIEKMLKGSQISLNTCYFKHIEKNKDLYDHIIYTGPIDQFFDYKYGVLEYRSLRFEREVHKTNDWQGNAVINYTDANVPWTRIIEHKHFDMNTKADKTVIYKEYPDKWTPEKIPFYPINDEKNNNLYDKYRLLADACSNVSFGGRLGEFKYYDMHQVIGSALNFCNHF